MSQRSTRRVEYHRSAGSVTRIILWILVTAALAVAATGRAQSSRPGWGSTPYNDASGTGVTFRVWAPNATSVSVPGSFNSWSTTATPLAQELSNNGLVDGVWSADVATAPPPHNTNTTSYLQRQRYV